MTSLYAVVRSTALDEARGEGRIYIGPNNLVHKDLATDRANFMAEAYGEPYVVLEMRSVYVSSQPKSNK